jgi:hypothetical protein
MSSVIQGQLLIQSLMEGSKVGVDRGQPGNRQDESLDKKQIQVKIKWLPKT